MELDIREIKKIIPHRFPFLMIDKVIEVIPNEKLVAIKNVSINEPFFEGHFPQHPVMPGVLIIEAMAQACGLLAFKSDQDAPNKNQIVLLVGVDKARFKRPVEPGDQLVLESTVVKVRRGLWMFKASATVDGQVASEAEILCTMKDV